MANQRIPRTKQNNSFKKKCNIYLDKYSATWLAGRYITLTANTWHACVWRGMTCMLVDRLLDPHAPHSSFSACEMGICEKFYEK